MGFGQRRPRCPIRCVFGLSCAFPGLMAGLRCWRRVRGCPSTAFRSYPLCLHDLPDSAYAGLPQGEQNGEDAGTPSRWRTSTANAAVLHVLSSVGSCTGDQVCAAVVTESGIAAVGRVSSGLRGPARACALDLVACVLRTSSIDHKAEIDMNRSCSVGRSMASRAQGAVRDCPVRLRLKDRVHAPE